MDIRRCGPDDGPLIRQLRLRALADALYAFGREAFAEESEFPDGHWNRLAAQVGGRDPLRRERCASFVAFDADGACGTITGYLCPEEPRRAYLSAAWIDPHCRRQGLGRRLVDEVVAWAESRGADHLRLWVDDTNPGAAEFYRALGFVPTGESRPVSEGSADRQSGFELELGSG
jgi:ribosomal protein S18 acetylase RimI-like enzyme